MRIRVPQPSLSDQQLATLHARFVVPIAVQMILSDTEQLDDACECALHECLSELQPDTGLLCLALCAQHVAAAAPDSPIVKMLAISAARMADEYGAALLAESGRGSEPLSDFDALMLLRQVPEDLEELATLLDAVLAQVDPHSPEGLLCDILSVQALSQSERAGHELAALSFLNPEKHARITAKRAPARTLERLAENVIVFPR
ncbi:MAG: hypothetical protein HYS17_00775 [Micavibrio aeruginosavorus]|uniref:Uncharacterized protein n=1 Tax=Micavibrio aeruginosavorus TaxID=349221 RepID=A0A7T5R2L0_9BACT|nr:MAG: hypothetical protein HYS17_00775 [Micavibrio aeruginosavorus]